MTRNSREMKSTKELARELGILRKRTLTKSSAVEADRKRAKKSNQIFSFLIVIDFESTCWQAERNRPQEIIEFPAVLLNTETGQIESEFHRYVQPQENPILSDFCKQLTGITQEQVDEAVPLFICLRQFSTWITEMSKSKMLTFGAADGASKPTAFVTWSDWDLGVCLLYECRRKQLRKPVELSSWIDLRATYRRYYQRRPQGLNGALQELGVSFEGREHSGLDDARNTAYLAWKMICDGCIMEITKTQTDATIGRTIPQLLKKPPSNPAVTNIQNNGKTPERQKITELQRVGENAKSKMGSPRQLPKNSLVVVQPTHRVNVTPRQSPKNARAEGQPTLRENCTPRQSPKNFRVDVQPTHGVNVTPRQSPKNIRVGGQPTLRENCTPRQSPKNFRVDVQPTHRGNGTPRQSSKNTHVEGQPTRGVNGTPRQSPKNTRVHVQPTHGVNDSLSDWGIDEIGDDDILQYLAVASPSFRNPSTTMQSSSELSYGSKSAGLALCTRMQAPPVRTPTSGRKRGVLRDITNSPSCVLITNSRSEKMLSHSPVSKSSSNNTTSKNLSSPISNCRKVLHRESGFTKIKSPTPKSTLTEKPMSSSSGIFGPSASSITPKNHYRQDRQQPVTQTAPSSSPKPLSKSTPSKVVSLGRICSAKGAQIAKNPQVKSPGKTLLPPLAKTSSNSVSLNRKIGSEQMSNPAIIKGVHCGSLNAKISEPGKGKTSCAVSLQHPQTAPKSDTPNGFHREKPQTTPRGSNISSNVILQKPQIITPVRPRVSTTSEQSFGSLKSTGTMSTPSTDVASFFRTPSGSGSLAPSSSMRKTPPMCDCGCRAKRKFVQSPGPNMGNTFFCCGSQRSRSGAGCKFFRWESSTQISPLSSSSRQTPVGCQSRLSISPMVQPQFNTPSVLTRPR